MPAGEVRLGENGKLIALDTRDSEQSAINGTRINTKKERCQSNP